MDVVLGPGDFLLDGDPAPLRKKGAEPPQFSAHVYCGQTDGWIKMTLGTEVGWFRVLAALLHGTLVVGVSQTLRR